MYQKRLVIQQNRQCIIQILRRIQRHSQAEFTAMYMGAMIIVTRMQAASIAACMGAMITVIRAHRAVPRVMEAAVIMEAAIMEAGIIDEAVR